MRNRLSRIVNSWGTRAHFHVTQYLWVLAMFAVLAELETNRVGLFLVPPFGATLSILLVLPDAAIAQPYALIVGSVAGASLGTVFSRYHRGPMMAIVAAFVAFIVLNLIRSYHPPGIALAMYPPLLHTGVWFPLLVVLPFTAAAVASAALLSRLVRAWPPYPKPLRNPVPS
jgi:CBS domain-containing membrane protein